MIEGKIVKIESAGMFMNIGNEFSDEYFITIRIVKSKSREQEGLKELKIDEKVEVKPQEE